MHITFTEAAVRQIEKQLDGRPAVLKLVYDTEGCGCAVNGVPALWLAAEKADGDRMAAGTPYEVAYDPMHEIFFEDKLKVDYQPAGKSFILKSDNQIYSASMSLLDKRESAAKA
jgi:uncharacterized protein YqkB